MLPSCQCNYGCCDTEIAEKGLARFAKQIGAFSAEKEEPLSASVLTAQHEWYRPPVSKPLADPDEPTPVSAASPGTPASPIRVGKRISLRSNGTNGSVRGLPFCESRRSVYLGPDPLERMRLLVVQLERAQHEATRRSYLIRVPTLITGLLLMIITFSLFMIFQISHDASVLIFPYALCGGWGCMLVMLSVLPSDKKIKSSLWLSYACVTFPIGAYATYLGIVAGIEAFTGTCAFNSVEVPCWASQVAAASDVASGLVALGTACYIVLFQMLSSKTEQPLRLLARTNAAMGIVWVGIGLFSFILKHSVLVAAGSAGGLGFHICGLSVGVLLLLSGGGFTSPRCRRGIQMWLGSRPGTTGAGLAELLGHRSVEEVIALAASNFRAVSAKEVREEHFHKNLSAKQIQELYDLSVPAEFGNVDAFVSHTWLDDSPAKWRAIQDWRNVFRSVHAREPLLWIDRYCQHRLAAPEAVAAVLPIYIAGSRNLLSLCGTQYFSSLRSLVELFIFAELGRSQEEFHLHPLPEAESVLRYWIDSLDVWKSHHDKSVPFQLALEAAHSKNGFQDMVKRLMDIGFYE
ncbi:unnamed protein product [Effrenium voratum]|nr:unnamed protein product [Effrenium voratum]|mmetsp:Transcript_79890/g.191859  ORF Transcript_79890/g.191859 Transcript_79890/m.191859 type:complete len:575 (+) Transcript_79890:69-1793(+)